MASPLDPVLGHHTSQERQSAALSDHTEQIEAASEKFTAEDQAGFRAGRSTTEQIFNLRILCEKHPQHQQYLYHVFIDFKKALDRVGMQLCEQL